MRWALREQFFNYLSNDKKKSFEQFLGKSKNHLKMLLFFRIFRLFEVENFNKKLNAFQILVESDHP